MFDSDSCFLTIQIASRLAHHTSRKLFVSWFHRVAQNSLSSSSLLPLPQPYRAHGDFVVFSFAHWDPR